MRITIQRYYNYH